jgi:hypothetical protein
MAVIVGAATQVSIVFPGGGSSVAVQSVDWSFSANIEKLYTLGGGIGACGPQVFATIRDSAVSVSFSVYGTTQTCGGGTPSIDLCSYYSATCKDSLSAIVTITPAACGAGTIQGLNAQPVFINSYSYQKDRATQGVEQWQGTAYVVPTSLQTCEFAKPAPSYVVLLNAEGTVDADDVAYASYAGVTFAQPSMVRMTSKGQVQASQMGEYTKTHAGTVSAIGGSAFWADGKKISASVQLQTQPVYVG